MMVGILRVVSWVLWGLAFFALAAMILGLFIGIVRSMVRGEDFPFILLIVSVGGALLADFAVVHLRRKGRHD